MTWGWILVEVCDANPADIPALMQLEEEFPGVTVLENACMSHCELCARTPYVLVDGEPVTAPNTDELLDRIRAELRSKLETQDSSEI
ncbi:DUF1450 domain-containing protein [Alicyclobacillus sp.]|uniref:DUF1450 domain-containing protein n=1 Tax=Alicyclobacillus sp. TaxID=61169 RepID=UPI0025C2D4A5|nr:DUF1450 domain-containing protein [Alicyclobacillus sp.]MCL6515744.1 YuzB family protein [Alicyclobacillus sp.]